MQIYQQDRRFIIDFKYDTDIISYLKQDSIGARFDGKTKKWWLPGHELMKIERIQQKFGVVTQAAVAPEQFGDVPPLPELADDVKDMLKRELLRPPYHYQEQGIAYILKNRRVINGDDMGGGKKNINGTPVLSENGWIAIENLQVGSKVYGRDGHLHNVTGVYPHPAEDIYRVSFSDHTYTDVGLEHLWAVRSLNHRKRNGGKWRVKNTAAIKESLRYKNGAPVWEIPLCEAICYEEKNLLIPPYIMGVLIADGGIQDGIRFVPGDKEVPVIVESYLPEGYKMSEGADYGTSTAYCISYPEIRNINPWIDYIRSVDLNVTGEHKYLPEDYLTGSISQRKELLAGLMDCDGESNGARCRYSTGSKRLADDVVSLVQSLGGLAVIAIKPEKTKVRSGRESHEQINYVISIRLPFNPFFKESAASKWKLSSKLIRQITSIEYITKAEATCIAVDAPDHLYIVNDYIVTHNTTTSIATVVAAGFKNKPGLVVCKGSGKFMWEREFKIVAGMKSVILTDSIKTTWYQFYQLMNVSVFITNYESLEKYFVEKVVKPDGEMLCVDHIQWKIHPTLRKPMIDLFEYVILDESHEIRNEETLKSVICVGLGISKDLRMALSGTPIVNKAKDIYAQLNFLGKTKNTKEGRKAFIDRYCGGNGAKSTNMKELHYKLSMNCYFRRNTDEFGIDLPPMTLQMAYCEITNRREYDFAVKNLADYLKQMKGKTDGQVEKSMNAKAMVLIGVLMEISARGKMREAIEEIDTALASGNKIVVFVNQKLIKEALIKHYPDAFVISGEENAVEKNIAESGFNNSKKVVPIIVSIKAGGVGINLQATCSHVLFIEFPWHPAFYNQCVKRVHRNGQKGHVFSKNLLGRNTIDERIWEIIESKKDIADTITGADDSDIHREIIDKVKESLFNPKNKEA